MSTPSRGRPASEIVALVGSAIVILLFVAAGLGIGMSSIHKLWRLRMATSTFGLVLLPIPAVAWVIALWSRPMPSAPARVLRIVLSFFLVLAAVLCTVLTVAALFMTPTERPA